MSAKVVDLAKERRKRRRKTGWTLQEIHKRAAELQARYAAIDVKEPDSLVSGDMHKLLQEEEEEDDDDDK